TDGDLGQCKLWLQQRVVNNALSFSLPPNSTSENAYSWDESVHIQQQASWNNGSIHEAIINPELDIEAGDMIQMANSDGSLVQHSLVIGRIEADGIWIIDSNYVEAKTPGYHKLSFDTLDQYDRYSIYRAR
ncbi:MAG: hypothetical protein AABZ06_02120, partial [Bdellovibrionota bacterium]